MQARIIVGIALLIGVVSAVAAESSAVTVQYLPSSSDHEEALGIGFYRAAADPVGFYGNVATTVSEREPHYDSLNTRSFGDPITERFKELTVFAIGITRSLGQSSSLFVGAGYGWGEAKAEKHDPTHILADDGDYYVDDPANDDSGANFNAGVLLTPGQNVTIELGYHSFPGTGYLGIGWKF